MRGARWLGLGALLVMPLLLATCMLAPNGHAALPPGAEPLLLRTQPPPAWPSIGGGCPAALVSPIRVGVDGDALTFRTEADGIVRTVVWPFGYSARLLDGRAELVDPEGVVLARDGDIISNLGGSAADNGDIIICMAGPPPSVAPGSSRRRRPARLSMTTRSSR